MEKRGVYVFEVRCGLIGCEVLSTMVEPKADKPETECRERRRFGNGRCGNCQRDGAELSDVAAHSERTAARVN